MAGKSCMIFLPFSSTLQVHHASVRLLGASLQVLSGGLGRLLVVMSGSRRKVEPWIKEMVSLDVFENKTQLLFQKIRKFMIYVNLIDDEVYSRWFLKIIYQLLPFWVYGYTSWNQLPWWFPKVGSPSFSIGGPNSPKDSGKMEVLSCPQGFGLF